MKVKKSQPFKTNLPILLRIKEDIKKYKNEIKFK